MAQELVPTVCPPQSSWYVGFPSNFKAAPLHDCSPIPVFCFLYSKILPVTKMRLNICFNEMALFGPFVALINVRR